jgi:tetratricopeptide (TPR) repeat protein
VSRGETQECNPEARVDAIWNDSVRAQLGAPAWHRTEREVNDYLAQWSAGYRDACRELADDAELDPVMRCFDRRLEQVTAALGTLHRNIAMALLALREDSRAIEHARQAVAIHEQNLDPHHPEIAVALVNLALAHSYLAEHDAAHAALARALEIRRRAFGEQHPRVASLLSRMARNALDRGDREGAIELGKEALAMVEAALVESQAIMIAHSGAISRDAAISRTELAEFLVAAGQLERSRAEAYEVLAILGELDEVGLGAPFNNGGDLLRAQGDHTGALEAYRQAAAAHVRDYSPTHPYVAYSKFRIGLALEGLARLDEAAAELETTMDMRAHENGRRFFAELPETRVALGRVELARGHRARALELLRTALQEYGDAPEHADARREASLLASRASRRTG